MKVYYSDQHALPLPSGHRFPVDKYRALRDRICQEGLVDAASLIPSRSATDKELQRVHAEAYLQSIFQGTIDPKAMRRIGFPWSEKLVIRSRHSTGATLGAAEAALACGFGINLAGGTHHAFADRGEGYCVFNDVAVAARQLQSQFGLRNILVIDCDVHQGNGTAAIFRDDPSVFTFSIHGAHNFPLHKEISDLDLALDDETRDEEYLRLLQTGLEKISSRFQPGFVFYLAGADPFQEDRFGRMKLTKSGLQERDRLVLEWMRDRNVPVAIAMAGGYAPQISDIVDIQSTTVRLAKSILSK
ncbi:MAG: histone deacetylase [Planctomycetaceae bacterium]|nr:histone deacetylase [Planctomycetaceae bacterium]